jgi:protein-disulfide isomerase
MKSVNAGLVVVVSVFLSLLASYGYLQLKEKDRPESYSIDPNSSISRVEIENIVQEFILEHPEVIVNSVDKMNVKEAQKEKEKLKTFISENLDSIHSNKNSPKFGNSKAKVKIVEIFDYRCGFCKRMMKVKDELIASGKDVQFIFIELPILGDFSEKASRAALAVNSIDPKKYMDFHRTMMNYSGPIDSYTIPNIVKSVGISEVDFNKALNNSNIDKIINDNKRLAASLNIMGSPAYLIGDELYAGALSYDEISEIIDRLSKQ